ncbi:MAG: hypothetical protein ABEJ82_06140 [Haloplanus sp.]
MDREHLDLLREECTDGNVRACHTLERLCEDDGNQDACEYVPE